jgi:hypothetical protein
VPIVTTGGANVTEQADGSYHVAKQELAATLIGVFAAGRLAIAPSPEATVLAQQIQALTIKITKNFNETFDSPSDSTGHGDLAMAVAYLIWIGENMASIGWDGRIGMPTRAGNPAYSSPPFRQGPMSSEEEFKDDPKMARLFKRDWE